MTELKPEDMDLYQAWQNLRDTTRGYRDIYRNEGWTDIDLFYHIKSEIKALFTETKIVEKPMKSTPEQLEQAKWYRENKKRIEKLTSAERKREEKIKHALERKTTNCYHCQPNRIGIPCINPTYELKTSPRIKGKRIIVLSKCDACGNTCKAFGGYVDVDT